MIGVKRAFVDLAKDRNGVAGIGTKHEGGLILDWCLEREFGTRKYADGHRAILRRGKSSCAGAEVMRDEFFANFGWARSRTVQTKSHISRNSCPRSPCRSRKFHPAPDRAMRGESEHHLARCLPSSIFLGRLSPTCSSGNAGLKSRTSFSGISSILL